MLGRMGGSRIFHWGGPHIEKAGDDRQNVALFALKSWPIGGGGGMALWAPPGTALAGIVLSISNTAWRSKAKLLVYMKKP